MARVRQLDGERGGRRVVFRSDAEQDPPRRQPRLDRRRAVQAQCFARARQPLAGRSSATSGCRATFRAAAYAAHPDRARGDGSLPRLLARWAKTDVHTHDYKRHGVVNLYAALEVATGEVTHRLSVGVATERLVPPLFLFLSTAGGSRSPRRRWADVGLRAAGQASTAAAWPPPVTPPGG